MITVGATIRLAGAAMHTTMHTAAHLTAMATAHHATAHAMIAMLWLALAQVLKIFCGANTSLTFFQVLQDFGFYLFKFFLPFLSLPMSLSGILTFFCAGWQRCKTDSYGH